MKKKLIFLVMLVCLTALNFIGCDMENTGYQVETYVITYSTYSNRPSGVTDNEALSYVKDASGTVSKGNRWHSNIDGVKDYLTETLGNLSNLNEVVSWIESDYTTVIWFSPGLFSPTQDYYFFYVENNNNK